MNCRLPVRLAFLVVMVAPLSNCAWLFGRKAQAVVAVGPDPGPPKPQPPKRPDPQPLLPDPEPEPPAPRKEAVPVARAVPGRPGFVFSPFNNKLIDVEGIPSGRLAADPHYPASEKKYFRVP
jgi:hypothetical protein